jgi:heterodisulfide reductase subunit A
MEKLGVRPERLRLEWISSAEGARFARIMREMEEMRQNVTSEEIEHTKKVLAEERMKKKKKGEEEEELEPQAEAA